MIQYFYVNTFIVNMFKDQNNKSPDHTKHIQTHIQLHSNLNSTIITLK